MASCFMLIKPAQCNDTKRQFNEHLSSTRSTVERAFGVLKARFRFLFDPSFARWTVTTYTDWFFAAVILHNMCRRHSDTAEGLSVENADGTELEVDPEDAELSIFPDVEGEETAAATVDELLQDVSLVVAPSDPLVPASTNSLVLGKRRRLRVMASLGFDVQNVGEELTKALTTAAAIEANALA
jgi:hypothetical protein